METSLKVKSTFVDFTNLKLKRLLIPRAVGYRLFNFGLLLSCLVRGDLTLSVFFDLTPKTFFLSTRCESVAKRERVTRFSFANGVQRKKISIY